MAKSKEQKRKEALERLTKRMAEDQAVGRKPTFSQRMEFNALSYPKREKTPIEKLFGVGDPVTGIIYADPLPFDFRPTPELDEIVYVLKNRTERFVELIVTLDTPDGYPYPTYQGGGTYLNQWVSRHTSYVMHHTKNLYGSTIGVVFSHKDEVPEYDENDVLIKGTTKEMYDRTRRNIPTPWAVECGPDDPNPDNPDGLSDNDLRARYQAEVDENYGSCGIYFD